MIEDDPIPPVDSAGANMGLDKEEDVQKALEETLEKAIDAGMSENGLKRASALLREFRDIFRIKLGPDPPAKV